MPRLKLLGTVSVLALVLSTVAARAANYIVSNETELLGAIASANADGDASSTITLTENLTIAGNTFPAVTKTLTIDTGGNILTSTGPTTIDVGAGADLTVDGVMWVTGDPAYTSTAGRVVKAGAGTLNITGGPSNYSAFVQATGGNVVFRDGAQVTFNSIYNVISQSNGQSSVTVTGVGTMVKDNSGTDLGTSDGATLNVTNGGHYLSTNPMSVGSSGTGSKGTVNVEGEGSLLQGSVRTLRGLAYVNITQGGRLDSDATIVGGVANASTVLDDLGGSAHFLVSGAGSQWDNSTYIQLMRGSIDVLNGGVMNTSLMRLGISAGTGISNAAITVSGAGSELNVTGGAANAFQIAGGAGTGARSGALTIANGGKATVGGGAGTVTLTTSASARAALNIGGAEGQAATGAGTLAAANVQFGSGKGVINFNHTNTDYGFDIAMIGNGTINQVGSGKTILTADQTAFAGQTNVRAGTLAVNGVLGGTMDVLGGRLQGIGTVGATTNHAGGMIAPGNSIGTLTVAGDYTSNGGGLEIESILGGDGSPSDLLVITGNSILGTGPTQVGVINLGGTGAPTVEGIKIVDVGGASDPGAFSLVGDYVFEGDQAVVGGAYAYRLYQNGVSTPADGDWYLRSALVPVVPPVIPPAPPAPLYQPGVPLYESYANVLQSFNALGTLQQRVGNRSWSGTGIVETGEPIDGTIQGNGVWGRIEAAHGNFNPKISTSGAQYDVDIWKLQAGVDGSLYDGEAGRLIGGISGHYGTISSDINSIFGNGSITSTGYGVGGTLTWYANNGFYLDGQAQVSWYDSDLTSRTAGLGLTSSNNGFGYGLSIEGGQKIVLGPNWSITPQAQLAYSEVNFDDFTDVFGASVGLDRGNSLKGRLGISADYQNEWRDEAGQISRSHVYGIANLYYDFLDGSQTDVAGVKFTGENDPLWGGIGIGGSYNWGDDKYSLYGEASVNTSLHNFGNSYALNGKVGLRVQF